MKTTTINPTDWYKNAVIYAIDVSRFYDADCDGRGDLKGITAKLDYIEALGINCIWLLPIQPSPGDDNGYDVTDFMDINPALGDLDDMRTLLTAAHSRGIRIIIDLAIQHTSIKHPWFIAASSGRDSQYKDYYVWTDQLTPENQQDNAFPTIEDGVWTYHERVRAYYRHQFYHFEADLNIASKFVQAEIYRIIAFWLAMGVDGFRIDAATFLLKHNGRGEQDDQAASYFARLRQFIANINPEAVLTGEADIPLEDLPKFFGSQDRFQMLYNFLLNNQMYASFADQTAIAVKVALERQTAVRKRGTWINFVRNNDELNLMHLEKAERDRAMALFASDPKSQIYDRGIRRRLPPMLNGNQAQLRMVYSLLFGLPGSPLILYGEELGMGDDLTLEERNSVRIPMQWDTSENAGFSSADIKDVFVMANTDPEYGYLKVNVAHQEKTADSLLRFFKALALLRNHRMELFIHGVFALIESGNDTVLIMHYAYAGHELYILHNFSSNLQKFTLSTNESIKLRKAEVAFGSDIRRNHALPAFGCSWIEIKP